MLVNGFPCSVAMIIIVFASFGIVPPGLRFGGPYPVAFSHRIRPEFPKSRRDDVFFCLWVSPGLFMFPNGTLGNAICMLLGNLGDQVFFRHSCEACPGLEPGGGLRRFFGTLMNSGSPLRYAGNDGYRKP